MSADALIGLDWGTTSCRAYLVGADGAVLDRVADGAGILKVENGAFGAALDTMVGRWDAALPVLLSGMIGSRQGWVEAPYARCPAGADGVVKALATVDHGRRTISLVPGLSTENDAMPDVMRGEERRFLGRSRYRGRPKGCFCCRAPIPSGPTRQADASRRSAPS